MQKGAIHNKIPDESNEMRYLDAGLDDDDACPVCLEGYTADNPRILTRCNHDFHLQCAMAWSERSQRCPVCDRKMDLMLELV